MKDDSESQMENGWSDQHTYSPRGRRANPGNSKALRILIGIILVFVFAGGILYFLGKRPAGDEVSPLQSKVTALEQKIAGLERQLAELRGNIGTPAPAPALAQRLDALAQKVEALAKEKQPTAEPKAKTSAPPKPVVSTEKQYHTVKKGETLYGISRKYKVSEEELRKLNNLSADQSIRIGQKLLVSPSR
jgi:LysM repeat protein